MPTYSAKATASASVVAQFFFRREETVTATASATAESNISEEAAYNIALQIAQDVANSAAQNDANVLIQSVNTSTLGDNTLFLSSSLLNGFVERVENVYTLVKDLDVPSPLKVIVSPKETFTISKGLTATMRFDNLGGTMYIYGKLKCGPAPKSDSKDFSNQIISKASTGDTSTSTSSNSGNLFIGGEPITDASYVPSLEIPSGETYTNESTGDIYINQAVPGYSGGTLTIDAGGTLINQGNISNSNSFTNNGIFTNSTYQTFYNLSTMKNTGTINNISGGFYNGSNNSTPTLLNSGIFNNGISGSTTNSEAILYNFGFFYFENNSQFNNYGTVNYVSNNAKFQGDPNSSDPPTYSIFNYESGLINLLNYSTFYSTLTVTTNGNLYTNVNTEIIVEKEGKINGYSTPLGNLQPINVYGYLKLDQGSNLYINKGELTD